MRTIIQVTNTSHTDAIEAYIIKKMSAVEKLLKERTEAIVRIEVGKSTKHHKKGDVYFAEANLHIKGKEFRVTKQTDDLYRAIDTMKDEVVDEVSSYLDKKRATKKKGGQTMKKTMRGEN